MHKQQQGSSYHPSSMASFALGCLACKQAHLFGWGASTESWREEWGKEKCSSLRWFLVPKQVSLLAGYRPLWQNSYSFKEGYVEIKSGFHLSAIKNQNQGYYSSQSQRMQIIQ